MKELIIHRRAFCNILQSILQAKTVTFSVSVDSVNTCMSSNQTIAKIKDMELLELKQ